MDRIRAKFVLMNDQIRHSIEVKMGTTIGKIAPVGGGSINDTYRLTTDHGDLFVKVNSASRYPGMFSKERAGLDLLRETGSIGVPEVLHHEGVGDDAYLLMEWLEAGQLVSGYWDVYAAELAALHRNTSDRFGLDHDNYIGSLPQVNSMKDTWSDFFAENRLLFQGRMAFDDRLLQQDDVRKIERVCNRLDNLMPHEQPALIHGDLWGGNFKTGPDGKAWIIDPAVYYGHREMDIGMSRLFGGFDPAFYDAYQRHFPMEKGWLDRVDLCNLYPLLVHVNLFGGSYAIQVRRILDRFA